MYRSLSLGMLIAVWTAFCCTNTRAETAPFEGATSAVRGKTSDGLTERDLRSELSSRYRASKTATGECYAFLGPEPSAPAPTLIVLSLSAEQSLKDPYFLQCGSFLLSNGYLCVSLDLPCHGAELRGGEAEGLAGWNQRLNAGEALVEQFNLRVQRIIDHLICKQFADPARIAICGTSRGGFLAFHAAASDPRIRCVIGMAPVTSLMALEEFRLSTARDNVEKSSLKHLTVMLAGRKIWIAIGDQDHRVGTDEAIEFARRLSNSAVTQKIASGVDLMVLAESRGHTLRSGLAEQSAKWLEQQIASNTIPSP